MKIKLTDIDAQVVSEAPSDNKQYARKNGSWSEVVATSGGTGGTASYPDFTNNAGKVLAVNSAATGVEWVVDKTGITEAPSNGKQYARKDGTWSEVVATGGSGGTVVAAPTLIQSATLRNDGTIALPSAPTPGNLMVFVSGGFGNSLNNYSPVGFTRGPAYRSDANNGAQLALRTVQSGDTGSYAVTATDNQFCALYEFSNVTAVRGLYGGYLSTSGSNWFIEALKPSGAVRIVVGENDTSSAFTVDAATGLTVDITTEAVNNHPGFIARLDDTFTTGRVSGTIANGFSAPVFGVFDVVGTEATGGGSGGGTADYPSFTGNARNVLAVNPTETGVEWVPDQGLRDAPADGNKYVRQWGNWTTVSDGAKGDKGDKGDTGAAGPGVPAGGYTGQVLAKINGEDFNTGWIDPPEGGGGGSADPTIDYANWGKVIAMINQTFDNGIVPTNFTWKPGLAGTIITDPDAGPSTTKALQYGSGSQGDNADSWFEFTTVADATNYNLRIRYKSQGENNYDGLRVMDNGAEVFSDRTYSDIYEEFNYSLTPGTHVIRVRFTSDGTAWGGFQNIHFSQILYPAEQSTVVYKHGDTVHHKGYVWLCLYEGTNEEPGSSNHWARFATEVPYRFGGFFTTTPGDSEMVVMHVVSDAFTLPANMAGTQVKVGVNPSGPVVFTLNQNSMAVGTVSISAAGLATLATSGPVTFSVGDLLTLTAPSDSLGIAATAFTFKGLS